MAVKLWSLRGKEAKTVMEKKSRFIQEKSP